MQQLYFHHRINLHYIAKDKYEDEIISVSAHNFYLRA
jgi:hypothetical protein